MSKVERLKPQIYNKVCSRKQRCKLYLLIVSCGQQGKKSKTHYSCESLKMFFMAVILVRVYDVENNSPSSCLLISLCSNLSLADPK